MTDQDRDRIVEVDQLPREIEPSHDLWPEIDRRIGDLPRRPQRGWLLAASLLIAALALGVWVWRSPRSGRIDDAGWTASLGNKTQPFALGDVIETAAGETAVVGLSDFGRINVRPGSYLRREKGVNLEHRFTLERGEIEASIDAPPRLFVVQTPATTAIDLGCHYTMQVQTNGDTLLHVLSGRVSLSSPLGEIEVPAGAICRARRGAAIGIPYYADAPEALRSALRMIEDGDVSSEAAQRLIAAAREQDIGSLVHSLRRFDIIEREILVREVMRHPSTPEGLDARALVELNDAAIARATNALMTSRGLPP